MYDACAFAPKARDRGDVGTEAKIRFSSAILPKWGRGGKSLDALLPVLYLRGPAISRRCSPRPVGEGGAEPLARGDHATDDGVAGGVRSRRLAEARPV